MKAAIPISIQFIAYFCAYKLKFLLRPIRFFISENLKNKKMVLCTAKRNRVMTKFRKVVHEIARQRLGTDFDTKCEHPLSLADLKPRDSSVDR